MCLHCCNAALVQYNSAPLQWFPFLAGHVTMGPVSSVYLSGRGPSTFL